MRLGRVNLGGRPGQVAGGSQSDLVRLLAAQPAILALRADLGVTLVSSEVSAWADQSGNARHFSQGTGSNRPTLDTLSGQAAIRFASASAQRLDGPSFVGVSTAAHAFVVMKVVADPAAGGAGGVGGLWRFGQEGVGEDVVPFTDGTIYDGFASTVRKTTVNPTPSLASATRVYEVVSASGEWTNKLDGSQLFTTGTNTVAWNAVARIGGGTTIATVCMNGWIAELLVFGSKRTAAQVTQIYGYLNNRYGLAVA